MSTLELSNYGVSALDSRELEETDGGIGFWAIVGFASMAYEAFQGFKEGVKSGAKKYKDIKYN